jgi:hypothetical protein
MQGVVGNVVEERLLRRGAKVWVTRAWTGGGLARLEVRGISKGGRIITKWVAKKALGNFRLATVPEHLERRVYCWELAERPLWATLLVRSEAID